jgi:hypothetical protein
VPSLFRCVRGSPVPIVPPALQADAMLSGAKRQRGRTHHHPKYP